MKLDNFISYVEGESCIIDDASEDDKGFICKNLLNGKFSYVPKQNPLISMTVVMVCRNLSIQCPSIYEDDSAVFEAFEKGRRGRM